MTTPALSRYLDVPFDSGTQVTQVWGTYTGDGVTSSYASPSGLVGSLVGANVEVDNVLYPRATGAATAVSNTVTLDSIPLSMQKVLIPGVTGLTFPASDQNDAIGRVFETYFFIADVNTIQFYQYSAVPGNGGIKLSFQHIVTADPTSASWFQLAPANADGTVGAYGSAGAPLYTPSISSGDTVQSNVFAGGSALNVAIGANFNAGDYIFINPIGVTAEVIKIVSIASNTLTLAGTGLQFNHLAGELLYTCGRKLWAKMTVPLNAVGGIPQTWYGTPLQVIARVGVRA